MKTKGINLTKIPDIPDAELTPTVVQLLESLLQRDEVIANLLDEIARLKSHKGRPKMKPSILEQNRPSQKEDSSEPSDMLSPKRPGSAKRKKTKDLTIHETKIIHPENIPEGSTFKDYHPYTLQSIEIKLHNTQYLLARWETPDGQYLIGELPPDVNGHFGEPLVRYILYQYYHNHVTQPLLLEELTEFGIEISAGQIDRILTKDKETFHQEKADILATGLTVSDYINVDDTGARHKGKNGYVTHIGNEYFSWFESTNSKSRMNFLELLRAGRQDYLLDDIALTYMNQAKLPAKPLTILTEIIPQRFENKQAWETFLDQQQITNERHRRIATESALLGSALSHGISPNLAIISDDAGQFNILILIHALCWLHAERTISKVIPFSDQQKQILENICDQIWILYQDLKAYKKNPNLDQKEKLSAQFDDIFTAKTGYQVLDLALKRIYKNKNELLLVLERPEIPLHNNTSEQALRDLVKKRKISGGTRSEDGRQARDTFLSLKKTGRKLGFSFWKYLKDRLTGANEIPSLAEILRQRMDSS